MTLEDHVAAVLDALGYRADPEGADTPARFTDVLRAFAPKGPPPPLDTFDAPGRDLVILRDLPFHSLCAHHLLPFHGTCGVAYRPIDRIAGLGAFPRALHHFARQPQLQERLAAQLADHLHTSLGGAPVVVLLRARQMCMEMRGAASPGEIEVRAARGDVDAELRGALGRP